jgi:WD40 repeat protein
VANFAVTAANHGLSWSVDGKSLAIAAIQPTDKLQVWDVINTDTKFNADPGSGATEVAWSPNGERLAVATSGHIKDNNFSVEGGAIFLYDPSTWTQLRMLPYAGFVGSLSWAPDNNRLVFASTTGDLKETNLVIWDVISDKTSLIGESLPGSGTDVKWSPDGTLIAVDAGESSVALIDPTRGRVIRQMAHGDKVISISWSPDSKRLATAGQSGAIMIWEVSSGNVLTTFDQGVLLTSMAWSPDGNYLASTGAGNFLWIWDAR